MATKTQKTWLPTQHRKDGSPRWIEAVTGCWLWTGDLDRDGYGRHGRLTAHREVWKMLRGSIPVGLELDHLCFVRCCVNPAHLEPVTKAENTRRAAAAARSRSTCRSGHDRSIHGRLQANGSLYCMACNVESKRRLRARRKAEVAWQG